MKLTQKNSIFIIFLVMAIDFSSDSIFRTFNIESTKLILFSQLLISAIIGVFLILFGFKMSYKIKFLFPFFIILVLILFGFFHGVLVNIPTHAINETIPFLFFISFLGFSSMKQPISIADLERFLRLFIYIMILKFIVYSVASFLLYGSLSWKVLMKQSPLLLIPLSVYFSKIVSKSASKRSNLLIFLIMVMVVFAMARMLFLGVIFLSIIYFLNNRILKAVPIIVILGLVVTIYILTTGGAISLFSKFLYGGDIYKGGLDYRLIQFTHIIERWVNSPILGVGFGYYTPGYGSYGELRKPFLLELDLLNFVSKVGFIGSALYLVAYILIFLLIRSIIDAEVRRTATALFFGLLGILVYSLGQTMHQSYIYWVCFAFVYGFSISHLRAQIKDPISEKVPTTVN